MLLLTYDPLATRDLLDIHGRQVKRVLLRSVGTIHD